METGRYKGVLAVIQVRHDVSSSGWILDINQVGLT